MNFSITKTWNSQSINHEAVKLEMKADRLTDTVEIYIEAPFFNSPQRPTNNPGDDFDLWNYEVVEAFFLSDSGKYLELEFGPFGHYLVLFLHGTRNIIKSGLHLDYQAEIENNKWSGRARIPYSYFPANVSTMNAYAIHGSDPDRVYESLYPVPANKYTEADFHRLSYFQPIDFKTLLPENSQQSEESNIWKQYL